MFVAVATEQAFDYVLIVRLNKQHLSAFETDFKGLYDSLGAEPELKILDVCF